MKQQYVGDINDYRKFALLRHLSKVSRIGVCWMLTAPDGGRDGRKTEYLQKPERWRNYDADLYDLLKSVLEQSVVCRLRSLERRAVVPGAMYFSEFVPIHPELRRAFFNVGLEHLRKAELIFYDPDNGLQVSSVSKGQLHSPKFLYWDEVAATYSSGHSVLIYQHFTRENRYAFMRRLRLQLEQHAPGAILRAYPTPHTVFLLVIHPCHAARLAAFTETIPADWGRDLMTTATLD